MNQTLWAGIVLISLMFIIIGIPCIFIAILGHSMLNKLAYFPSKTPAVQMSILGWLLLVEVVSVTLLLMFYHIFADYGSDSKKNLSLLKTGVYLQFNCLKCEALFT